MSSKPIELQASEWLARLDAGDDSPHTRAALNEWRAADPRHEVAYLRMKAGWNRLDRLQALRPVPAVGVDADLLRPREEPRAPLAAVPPRRIPWAMAAGIAIAIAAAAVLLLKDPTHSTEKGGFERVQLADGSVVELNTDTRIRSVFDRSMRRIELLHGEAYFTVARDPTRPFVVMAGDTAVRALGTAFNVRREGERVIEVIVTEGKVTVGESVVVAMPQPVPSSAPVIVAGHSVSVVEGRVQVRESPRAQTDRELAWQSGMLLFDGDPLSDVVREFNRYNRRQLEVADPSLASLKIGGYFKAANLDVFVSVLQRDFGVRASDERGRILLRGAGGE